MNPVRAAIYDLLAADTSITDLANGIFWKRAPQGTQPPVVIYSKQTGTRAYTFDGPPSRNEVYLVKGVGFEDDAAELNSRCLAVLADAEISIDGRTVLLKPLAQDDTDYGEDTDGESYEHIGTDYRIITEGAE